MKISSIFSFPDLFNENGSIFIFKEFKYSAGVNKFRLKYILLLLHVLTRIHIGNEYLIFSHIFVNSSLIDYFNKFSIIIFKNF